MFLCVKITVMNKFIITTCLVLIVAYTCLYKHCRSTAESNIQILAADTPTDEEVLLSALISSEAHEDDIIDKYLVGSTVLNRVSSKDFPNTIWGVIHQPSQYHGVYGSNFTRTELTDSIAARLIRGENRDYEVLYFYNIQKATDHVFIKRLSNKHKFITNTKSHAFYGAPIK